jgi:hypothetical protein
MTSILKVDVIQKLDGSTPTPADLGLNVSGSVLQVFNHKTTSRLTTSGVGGVSTGNTIVATDGVTYTTFNFTPTSGTSILLLLSTVLANTLSNLENRVSLRLCALG